MANYIDLTGKRFNNLTVIERAESTKNGRTRWLCKCDCGNETVVSSANLKTGAVKSCGCLRKKPANKTHGLSKTPLYRMWRSMIYRCENPNHKAYKTYGGRGITVCEEWHDFTAFKKWVDETKPNGNVTIDRINNNECYSPQNCRWADMATQANNRNSNLSISYNGETHNLMEWSDILNFDYKRVHNRMHKLGWSFEKSIMTPVDDRKRNKVERTNNGGVLKK